MVKTCSILGNHISILDMPSTLEYLCEHVKEMSGEYICVCNVHTTMMSYEDEGYKSVQNHAVMNLPDGKPLSVLARHYGYHQMGRVTGPDLMSEVFRCSVKQGWRHFFYGATDDTLSLLQDRLQDKYPGIQIAGMYSPPFRELTKAEDEHIIRMINEARPDFVWIGLGAPKQEFYMYQHKNRLTGVMVGVGAGFNFHAGTVKRAPVWMQNVGLEWFYRMMMEPKRLIRRYMGTNLKFMRLMLKKGAIE